MNTVSFALGTQVFVIAGAFGALINMYSVSILRNVWSTYSYGDPARLPWAKDTAALRVLIGTRAVRYLQTRSVMFPWFELSFASLVVVALVVHGLDWRFFRITAFLAFALPLAVISSIDDPDGGALTPDTLTIPGALVGLLTSWLPGSIDGRPFIGMLYRSELSIVMHTILSGIASSTTGMVVGYLSLYGIYRLFRWATGKEGMGFGSFKANMMIGAFCGPILLLDVILISSIMGLICGVILKLRNRLYQNRFVPFTPFQMIGGTVVMLLGANPFLSR